MNNCFKKILLISVLLIGSCKADNNGYIEPSQTKKLDKNLQQSFQLTLSSDEPIHYYDYHASQFLINATINLNESYIEIKNIDLNYTHSEWHSNPNFENHDCQFNAKINFDRVVIFNKIGNFIPSNPNAKPEFRRNRSSYSFGPKFILANNKFSLKNISSTNNTECFEIETEEYIKEILNEGFIVNTKKENSDGNGDTLYPFFENKNLNILDFSFGTFNGVESWELKDVDINDLFINPDKKVEWLLCHEERFGIGSCSVHLERF